MRGSRQFWCLSISSIIFVASAQDLDMQRAVRARRPERVMPVNEFDRLDTLFNAWRVQVELSYPTPSWADKVPEVERKALEAALVQGRSHDSILSQALLKQARLLRANPEVSESADRLFVLAALRGAADTGELREIARGSRDPALRERARKLAVIAGAIERPYTELTRLEVPLPDLSQFTGRPVVSVFWAASDTTFQQLWPKAKAELQTLANAGVQIVGINFDPPEQDAWRSAFLQSEQVYWPSIERKDKPLSFSVDYCINSLPSYWLMDKAGTVRATGLRGSVAQTVLSLIANDKH